MPTIQELLEDWQATDILEHWDEFTTIQPHRHKTLGLDVMVYISHCEMCRTPLWLYMKKDNGALHVEHKLTHRCKCDDMEEELHNDDELPGMWSHSDFEGGDPDPRSYHQREMEAGQPTHITDVENYDGWPRIEDR